MNKERRKRLGEAIDLLEQVKSIVEECEDEEQEFLDNMPESFRNGEKGSVAEANVSELENADSVVEGVIDDLNSLCENIDESISLIENGQE